MKIAVIGGDGREHCLLWALRRNPEITKLYALPGNGGIAEIAECVPVRADDVPGIVAFCREKQPDFVVVAPDDPLALGAVDALHALGIPCFGPTRAAARLESSKSFAKELMRNSGIPTARYEVFTDEAAALRHIEEMGAPIVVKADGLALGKGVTVASTVEEAKAAVHGMLSEGKFGQSGARVVIEECLAGPEVSVLSFTDGETVVPMVSSMDHKRALDGDRGPNTGGMGAVAPNPLYTPEIADRCMREIFLPTVRAMRDLGCPFKGCLYFGLMLTKDGPKVIEYNARFGDPETQAVLPLLESDLLTVMRAVEAGKLAETPVRFSDRHACCVVVASGGYPGPYKKGLPVQIEKRPGVLYFHAGTALQDGALVTSGGRVLGVTAVGDTLQKAVEAAEEAALGVRFEGAYFRRDIGRAALSGRRD